MTLRRFAVVMGFGVVLGIIAVGFTPLSLGQGGRDCGPEMLQLYRFVMDDVVVQHGLNQRELFSFQRACRTHDNCYARASVPRLDCDQQFRINMQQVCAQGAHRLAQRYCALIARGFYDSVRLFGWLAYDTNAARRVGR